jgi:hypothetical protein
MDFEIFFWKLLSPEHPILRNWVPLAFQGSWGENPKSPKLLADDLHSGKWEHKLRKIKSVWIV